MAISFIGQVWVPGSENTENVGTTITLDKDNADVTDIATGDVVLVYVVRRLASGNWSVTTTGGQTWTEVFDQVNNYSHALYTCVFDGTWTADPIFTQDGASGPIMGAMWVFRGVDSTIWDVTPVVASDANDQDFATYNTVADGAWALVFGEEGDDNTCTVDNSFVALSGSGNIYWRALGSASANDEQVIAVAQKLMATAGAVGATTLNYSANDTGGKVYSALKPTAAPVVTGTSAITGVGSQVVAALLDVLGVSAVSGTGAISSSALNEVLASLAITGAGSQVASALNETYGVVGASGAGSVSVAALLEVLGISSIDGLGSVVAAGDVISGAVTGDAVLAALGALSAIGHDYEVTAWSASEAERTFWRGSAALAGAGNLVGSPLLIRPGSSSIVGAGTTSASASLDVLAQSAVQGAGSVTVSALVEVLAAAGIDAVVAVLVDGSVVIGAILGSASLSGTGSLTAASLVEVLGQAGVTGAGTLTAQGVLDVLASSGITGTASVQAISLLEIPGAAAISGVGSSAISAIVVWVSGIPTGLTAIPISDSEINLDWNTVADADGYDIERDGIIFVFLHPVSDYADSGLSEGSEHTYRVRAMRERV